jgi:hypothetical protein
MGYVGGDVSVNRIVQVIDYLERELSAVTKGAADNGMSFVKDEEGNTWARNLRAEAAEERGQVPPRGAQTLPPGYDELLAATAGFVEAFERGQPHKRLTGKNWADLCRAYRNCLGPTMARGTPRTDAYALSLGYLPDALPDIGIWALARELEQDLQWNKEDHDTALAREKAKVGNAVEVLDTIRLVLAGGTRPDDGDRILDMINGFLKSATPPDLGHPDCTLPDCNFPLCDCKHD